MKTVLTVIALLASSTLLANQADFARGRVLETTDDSPAQRLAMPDDVYEWVVRPDLGDLRVFNSNQEEVPYTVVRPQRTEEYTHWEPLPIFPLPRLEGKLTADPRIEIQMNDKGAIVDFAPGVAALEPATAFLLDATNLDSAPTELRLDWEGSQAKDFVGRVKVEAGDDLDEWETLVDSATIARLENAGHVIEVNEISLPPRKARYLRISEVEGDGSLVLSRAEARHRRTDLPVRRWKSLEGKSVDGGYEFESGGHFPIDRLQLTEPGDASYLVNARLFSRTTASEKWRNRGEYTFYRTNIEGETVQEEPLALGHREQYWRVEFDAFDDTTLTEPTMRIGWLPDELVFLQQGPAPYVLAYGQAGVEPHEWPLHQLLQRLHGGPELVDIGALPYARALDPEMLGGPERLKPPPEPTDWQTVVLWSVLVLGVLVVSLFAWRLLRSPRPSQGT
ncbi:MAG: DUF3999 domain-containing protein [Pseudomonadales bacterium]